MASGGGGDADEALPLLRSLSSSGSASTAQTFGNIAVSIVGTGALGLPYAFKNAGWLAGSAGVILASFSTNYCMLLLVQCRNRLEAQESREIHTYGHLGSKALGMPGRYLTEFLVLVSQCGGSVSYLVFIGQNLSSIFRTNLLTYSSVIFLLVPVEIVLSFIRSLSMLAPFSAFADLCNVLAMGIVLKEDIQRFDHLSERRAVSGVRGLPFAVGVAVFCYDGFSMTLALESSMKERKEFRRVMSFAFAVITLTYICFGLFGYLAFGDETRDIITLSLPAEWSTTAVKIGLCIALIFTFPIMMHPAHEIVEEKLKESAWFRKLFSCEALQGSAEKLGLSVFRALLIVSLAALASFVPGFGDFISLVGSTVCAMLAFVLPTTFHLILMGPSLSKWERLLDIFILVSGIVLAGYSTYNTVHNPRT